MANQRRASWPGERLCYSCFYAAIHTRGICPQCGHDGILAGLAMDAIRRPICLSCARIPGDFTCRDCGTEGDFYRCGTCARCSLRQDLTALMIDGAQRRDAMAPIVEALCRVDRIALLPGVRRGGASSRPTSGVRLGVTGLIAVRPDSWHDDPAGGNGFAVYLLGDGRQRGRGGEPALNRRTVSHRRH